MLRFHSRFEFQVGHSNLLRSKPICTKSRGNKNWLFQKTNHSKELPTKEVCNVGVACGLLKLGSLEKTIIGFLFHSGLLAPRHHFVVEKTMPYVILGKTGYAVF